MSNEINSKSNLVRDREYKLAFGWLVATAVSIACWAGLA
jgi:hypothetical protein